MELCVIGHSLSHVRQQNFFSEVAKLGHDVLLRAPDEWNGEVVRSCTVIFDQKGGSGARFTLAASPVVALGAQPLEVPFDSRELLSLADNIERFPPSMVLVQQEPNSMMALVMSKLSVPHAIFTWENLHPWPTGKGLDIFDYDLVICGNDGAQRIAQGARATTILPQVGVDTDHFQARPGISRNIPVAYIGRQVPEKGVEQLSIAYPGTKFLPWKPYLELPWWYSQAKIVVCFSQDTAAWREQAMPYVAVEAMCCGAAVIASDAGSIPFWLKDCPGAILVPQKSVSGLRDAIDSLLNDEERRLNMALEGRKWVEANLSSRIIAGKLVEALEGARSPR